MCEAIPPIVVEHRQDVELGSQRWIVRLWGAVILLHLMLPVSAYPGAPGATRPGLGVSQSALQAVFARQAFALRFEAPNERQSMPRVTGTVPGKLIALNLVGPPEDLTEVMLTVGVPSTRLWCKTLAPPRDIMHKGMTEGKEGNLCCVSATLR